MQVLYASAPSLTSAFPLSCTGVPKHHINNANLMRNGADFAVLLNTAQEFDGSDSGAKPDEAVSWGKIRPEARPVKVCGDATILFPLVLSQTFAKHWKPADGTADDSALACNGHSQAGLASRQGGVDEATL